MSFQFQPTGLDHWLDEVPKGSTQIEFNDAVWVPIVCAMHADPATSNDQFGYQPACQFCREAAGATLSHILAVHGGAG